MVHLTLEIEYLNVHRVTEGMTGNRTLSVASMDTAWAKYHEPSVFGASEPLKLAPPLLVCNP